MARRLVILGSVGLLVLTSLVRGPDDRIVFLDVGQGDSILLQQGTRQVLIDGGAGMAVLNRLAEELPQFDRTIDVVIATHPDRDHLEGLLHVIERYRVNLVLLPQYPHTTALQATWLATLEQRLQHQHISYRFGWSGERLRLGELHLTLLGPMTEQGAIFAPGKKTNNAAILTRVDFHGLSVLLTSDAEAPIEQRLVASVPAGELNVDILKAGHHGSQTSTTAALLQAASPAAVVISVGKGNRYGHPHPTVLTRLQPYRVYRTDREGSIRWRWESGRWYVQTGRLFTDGGT